MTVKEAIKEALVRKRIGGISMFAAIQRGYPAGDNSGPWCLEAIATELAAAVPVTERVVVKQPKTLVEVLAPKKEWAPPEEPKPKKRATKKKVARRTY